MTYPRLPDGAIYAAVVVALLVAALGRREHVAPAATTLEPAAHEGTAVAAASLFDPAIVVRTPAADGAPQAGTAFSVSGAGVWLTARHVVDGCSRIALMVRPDRGVMARVRLDPQADVAALFTDGGAPGLPLALRSPLHVAQRGYHPGFPQGTPGEATSRLMGRQLLVLRFARRLRGAHAEPVLAWAEVAGAQSGEGDLAGLSGAPVLDDEGRVRGLTLAEAPRRGRIYTTAPEALAAALARLGVHPDAPLGAGPPVTIDDYAAESAELRQSLQVVQVRCLEGAAIAQPRLKPRSPPPVRSSPPPAGEDTDADPLLSVSSRSRGG